MVFNLRLIHNWSFCVLYSKSVYYIFSRLIFGKRHYSWLCLTSGYRSLLSFCSSFPILLWFLYMHILMSTRGWPLKISVILYLCIFSSMWNPLVSQTLSFILSFQEVSWAPSVSSLPPPQPRNFLKGMSEAIIRLTLHCFPLLGITTLHHLVSNILKALSHIFYLVFQLTEQER